MKKMLLTVLAVFLVQSAVLADEIIDSKGNIIPCNIVGVSDGLIEYEKDGCYFTFNRAFNDPVFSDYVDVRKNFFRNVVVERVQGYLSCKNMGGVIIKNQNGIMDIPWYRVKNTGVYKPD